MTGPFGHGKVSIPSKAGEWSLLCISDMYLELAVQSCLCSSAPLLAAAVVRFVDVWPSFQRAAQE